jgi:DNA-binding SARP family transcriptional activator
MSQLQLSLLGVPVVKHGERTLTFPTRKALALLVYLIVEGGTHQRKTLSESFWPELDAEHGRAALRATLLELRKLLERSHEPGELAHLLVERDTLGFDVDSPLIVDIQSVESASKQVGRGTPPMANQDGGELLAQLEQATQQATGPFLAGFTLRDSQFFDDWTRQQREYWHLRVHQLFDALSLLYERSGDVERAIETLTSWLNFDPLNEEGYRRLMRLRFSKGDRTGALRAYADCRAVLADQLQVDPEPETIALVKRIRHTAPVRGPQVRSPQLSRTSPGQPPTNLLDGPFLGRKAEFGTLIECFQHAHAGRPQLVLLQGEAGIGKTRLATEFVRWAQAQGADVLVGRALQTGRQLPYQPLIDVLRRGLGQEHAPDDLLSNVWLAELSRLLPELRDRYPNLPVPSTDKELGHNRLFEATARLVQVWAERRPLVLLLDDMQGADTATLDLLLYLARNLAEQSAPVLLLLTLCTGSESCVDSQTSWLMALKRTHIPMAALQLAAFSQEETQRFVQGIAWVEQPLQVENFDLLERGSQNGEARLSRDALVPFANWLYFQTRGLPLYLVEALKELLTRGIIVPSLQENGSWGLVLLTGLLAQTPVGELIPSSVRGLIRFQLGQLTPTAWELLVAGAALGQGLTFELLIEVAQIDEQEGLRALEELLSKGLLCERRLVEDSQAIDGYAFPREMLREVVYQEAGTTRKRLVQQRVARLMREEEARLLHPAPVDEYESAETGNEQVRWVESRSVLGIVHQRSAKDPSGARGRQSDVRVEEQILLALPGMRENVCGTPEFQRSPPGSAFQSFL